ncbi:prepilin-type N-terminal cleavage/methylation domain-containing protein [bacterium]|nr:prepilin-type N-terminal cleavage/methylation domain-containing protein [bacterium]
MTRRSAFTLIELLIVVAIIAILAAIAVPNFLEAQTRAKVSRVKSDHRAIATAFEAYHVDNNAYPPQGPVTLSAYPWIGDETRVYGGDGPLHAVGNPPPAWHASTPIAYLSSTSAVFADPFFRNFGVNGTNIVNDTRYYNYSGDYYKGRTYRASSDGSISQFEATSRLLQQVGGWHLRSRGPDGDYEPRSNGWSDFILYRGQSNQGTSGNGGINAVYDPTNGTVSDGDIARFGKGVNPGLK